jgi:hypothetical protein
LAQALERSELVCDILDDAAQEPAADWIRCLAWSLQQEDDMDQSVHLYLPWSFTFLGALPCNFIFRKRLTACFF